MIGSDLPKVAGMPTEESVRADALAALGDEAVQGLTARVAFCWKKWHTICLCRYVGQPIVQSALAARVPRQTLYGWFEGVPGLKELLEGYDSDAQARLAARLHQFAEADEDSLTTRWMAERRCAQFRPPAKQVEMEVRGPVGVRVVLQRGDGQIVEPPKPQEEPTDAGD